jgi:hypothetical protein
MLRVHLRVEVTERFVVALIRIVVLLAVILA